MAKGSHVPKFGNWDSENIPYTTYFENARKDKGTGVKKINPNDPEENPDAFAFGTMGRENDGYYNEIPPSLVTSDRRMTHVAKPNEEHFEREGPIRLNSRNRKSSHSESSSEKSSSDFSLLRQKNRPTKSSQNKIQGEVSNGFSPMSPPTRLKTGTNFTNETRHQKAASVPKFGAWDETDPKSGEGFTIIFNKVKEEKQIAATKFPPIPSEPPNYSKASSSSKSKRCCGLF
ncbi:Pathogenic type III effector avirulence factor Avr cleavage site [Macleaya cordata]|uniref:Pathogenic type III effector avirulence factor Avr cleavage site n=1 Tax=Macleaya cordata TaxID=56857 RepID=A0A200PSE0_MACCD|nr:Pathogenic type III effector avirulence factor Avr cleavage site [Macleaya cordata]